MEFNTFLWQAFERTGDIDAYLLYRSSLPRELSEENDGQWQSLRQEALL